MNFEQQRTRALEIAKAAGIREPKYSNPVFKQMWKMGIEIRPPHYVSYPKLTVIFSLVFSFLFTILMFLRFRQEPIIALELGLAFGFVLGFIIASLYQQNRKKYNLPHWDDIRLF